MLNNLFKKIKNSNKILRCNINTNVNNPFIVEIDKQDVSDIYAVVRKIYLMGDTIKKRNKGLWRLSANIIKKTEPYLISEKNE